MAKTVEAVEAVEAASVQKDPFEKVKIKLAKTRTSKTGLFVNVNNYNYFIPRGEVVEVPLFIAEVIQNSVEQDEHTAGLIESLTREANF